MFIIAHRTAAGLAPENTLFGIEKAIECGADAIECDIRVTRDGELVLCHDDTLLRISGRTDKVTDLTLKAIGTTATHSGHPIPTLREALETAKATPLVIEGKGSGWAVPLRQVLERHKGPPPLVIAYNHRELVAFSEMLPGISVYANEDHRPIEAIAMAKNLGLTGVSLASSLYAPWVYLFARRAGLELITSPINDKWATRIFHAFYPRAKITTDFPDRFKHHKRN